MKIKDCFILKNIAGNNIVVSLDDTVTDLSSMITANETAAFLWDILKKGCTKEELLDKMLSEYDVEKEIALEDIDSFIDLLKKNNMLE